MEKRRPTYDLKALKAAIGTAETLAISRTATRSAAGLGFDHTGVAAVIQSIQGAMFHKSMTTFEDHRIWQDVYHVPCGSLLLYVKFQEDLISEFFVVSFKEK